MLRSLFTALATAALLAAAVHARRSTSSSIPDDYTDYSTDVYLMDLSTATGPLLIETRLPFLGTEWGQYKRLDDDE